VPSRQPLPFVARLLLLAGSAAVAAACVPEPVPHTQRDVPRHQRGIDLSLPYLAFRGRAGQMGDLGRVASTYRLIAVDAEPVHKKFTREELAALRGPEGKNIVLGIVDVGFCDRTQFYWKSAPDELLSCASNLLGQIGARKDHPQQVWMRVDDPDYQSLIVEYVAPRIAKSGVDGFLLDGLELLDRPDDDPEAPCDSDCVNGAIDLLTALRKEFPDMVVVMNGGFSKEVREAMGRDRIPFLLDGIVAEEVYTPSYDAQKEADLSDWRGQRKVNGRPFAVITQDYVDGCDDTASAQKIFATSRSHGFSPAVSPSPTGRARVCSWGF
jgi:cysteinyl-tRNA synthetase